LEKKRRLKFYKPRRGATHKKGIFGAKKGKRMEETLPRKNFAGKKTPP